jgi:hypothetical protein
MANTLKNKDAILALINHTHSGKFLDIQVIII